MQHSLPRRNQSWRSLLDAIASAFTAAARRTPAPIEADRCLTDQMEREFAAREFKRWH